MDCNVLSVSLLLLLKPMIFMSTWHTNKETVSNHWLRVVVSTTNVCDAVCKCLVSGNTE